MYYYDNNNKNYMNNFSDIYFESVENFIYDNRSKKSKIIKLGVVFVLLFLILLFFLSKI